MKPIRLLILGVLLSAAASVQAQKLTPAPYLCDSMVLQRDMPLPLEGTASPRSSVEISFADHTVTAETDAQGVWQATLPALEASNRNRTMEIRCGGDTVTIRDIVVGEVWLAGGQSNMAFKVRGMEFDDRSRD